MPVLDLLELGSIADLHGLSMVMPGFARLNEACSGSGTRLSG
jgi:hypothetical protein